MAGWQACAACYMALCCIKCAQIPGIQRVRRHFRQQGGDIAHAPDGVFRGKRQRKHAAHADGMAHQRGKRQIAVHAAVEDQLFRGEFVDQAQAQQASSAGKPLIARARKRSVEHGEYRPGNGGNAQLLGEIGERE